MSGRGRCRAASCSTLGSRRSANRTRSRARCAAESGGGERGRGAGALPARPSTSLPTGPPTGPPSSPLPRPSLPTTHPARRPLQRAGFDDSVLRATGTPLFYAPEMCVKGAFHGRPADVWASGVTLAMLAGGMDALPFPADNMPDVFRKIREEEPVLPDHISPQLRSLLLAMLSKNPDARPKIAALRQHPWVTNNGAEPMPDQGQLEVDVSDDDMAQAVHTLNTTFTVMKATLKFRQMLVRQRRASAMRAIEVGAAAEPASPLEADGAAAPAPAEAERV